MRAITPRVRKLLADAERILERLKVDSPDEIAEDYGVVKTTLQRAMVREVGFNRWQAAIVESGRLGQKKIHADDERITKGIELYKTTDMTTKEIAGKYGLAGRTWVALAKQRLGQEYYDIKKRRFSLFTQKRKEGKAKGWRHYRALEFEHYNECEVCGYESDITGNCPKCITGQVVPANRVKVR